MKTILLNASAIESCVDKHDACVVKTKTGSIWVLCKTIANKKTFDVIRSARLNEILELPLKNKEV